MDIENKMETFHEYLNKYGIDRQKYRGLTALGDGLLDTISTRFCKLYNSMCPDSSEENVDSVEELSVWINANTEHHLETTDNKFYRFNDENIPAVGKCMYYLKFIYGGMKENSNYYDLFNLSLCHKKASDLYAFVVCNETIELRNDFHEAYKLWAELNSAAAPHRRIIERASEEIASPKEWMTEFADERQAVINAYNSLAPFVSQGLEVLPYPNLETLEQHIFDMNKRYVQEEKRRNAIERRRKEMVKNCAISPNAEMMSLLEDFVNGAKSMGLNAEQINRYICLTNPNSATYRKLDVLADVYKQIFKRIINDVKDLEKLQKKLLKRKKPATEPEMEQYEVLVSDLMCLKSFKFNSQLTEKWCIGREDFLLCINEDKSATLNQDTDEEYNAPASKILPFDYYYQDMQLHIDVNVAEQNITQLTDELVRRGDIYIYPLLVVHGIKTQKRANDLADLLHWRVNNKVNFFAAIDHRFTTDYCTYSITDDESWK